MSECGSQRMKNQYAPNTTPKIANAVTNPQNMFAARAASLAARFCPLTVTGQTVPALCRVVGQVALNWHIPPTLSECFSYPWPLEQQSRSVRQSSQIIRKKARNRAQKPVAINPNIGAEGSATRSKRGRLMLRQNQSANTASNTVKTRNATVCRRMRNSDGRAGSGEGGTFQTLSDRVLASGRGNGWAGAGRAESEAA